MDRDSELDSKVKELLRDARSADRIDRERAELFGTMLKSPAWQEYIALLERQLQIRADVILGPAQSVDAMIGMEYVKGAMSGLILARDLPSVTILAMEQLRRDRAPVDEESENE